MYECERCFEEVDDAGPYEVDDEYICEACYMGLVDASVRRGEQERENKPGGEKP